MEKLFLEIVNRSITAGYLVLALVFFRLVIQDAPKSLRCGLWGLVVFRLVCAFDIKSALSLIPNESPLTEDLLMTPSPQISTGIVAFDNFVDPILSEHLAPAVGSSADPIQIWLFILSRIWLLGTTIMLGYALVSYLLLCHRVKPSISNGKNVMLCDHIHSPFILGLVKPKIYLPSDLPQGTIASVMAHENAHLARRDHWWKPFGFLLLSVYWFHPLMWLAYALACRDIEMACDERVIRQMSPAEKKSYSAALLRCSVPRKFIAVCPLAFGECSIKERVKAVLRHKKAGRWTLVFSILAAVVIGICFLTNPVNVSLEAFQPADGSYTITEQVYWNPLSSYYYIPDDTCCASISGQEFTLSFGSIFVHIKDVQWNWKPMRQSIEELSFFLDWLDSDWASLSAVSISLDGSCRYQQLNDTNHLLLTDDGLYFIHGAPAKNDLEAVSYIFKLEPVIPD